MATSRDDNMKFPCYIATTKYSAGIFLSRKIASRQKYAKHLKLEEFDCLNSAIDVFVQRYPGIVECEDFRLNRIFQVKEKPLYTVFWTLNNVVITEDNGNFDKLPVLLPDDWREARCRENMTYEDAQMYASIRFARIYKDQRLCISSNLRINMPISLESVKHRYKVSRTGY